VFWSVDYCLIRKVQVGYLRHGSRDFLRLKNKVYTTTFVEINADEHTKSTFWAHSIITVVKMPRRSSLITKEARRALKVLPKAFRQQGLTAATEAIVTNAKPILPRLWNAKRRIKSGRILDMKGALAPKHIELAVLQKDKDSQAWKKLVSEDVVKFIEDAKLPMKERRACLANPNAYFAYPINVPDALRKQVYLYETLPCVLMPYC
jgi:hypothetical protein